MSSPVVAPQLLPEVVTKVQYKSMSLFVIVLLLLLIGLNVFLYMKLWELEQMEAHRMQYPDFTKLRWVGGVLTYLDGWMDHPSWHAQFCCCFIYSLFLLFLVFSSPATTLHARFLAAALLTQIAHLLSRSHWPLTPLPPSNRGVLKRSPIYSKILRDPPKSHEDWIRIMQEQERLHNAEMGKWQSVLQIAVDLLRKVSVVCKRIVKDGKVDGLDLLMDEDDGEEVDGGGDQSLLSAADDLLRHREF